MKRSLIAAALAGALLAPASAQSPADFQSASPGAGALQPGHDRNEAPGFLQNQSMADWRSTKLIGADVYGPDNAKIGDIKDVLIGSDGSVRAVVVGVGGFLGMAEKNVALPFKALTITRKMEGDRIEKISVDYTKDQLKGAPAFAFYEPPKLPQTTGESLADKAKDLKDKAAETIKMQEK